MFGVARGGGGGGQPGGSGVERRTDALNDVHDMGRAVGPAYAQARQPVDLRESPGHHHIFKLVHQLQSGGVIGVAHILRVGGV